MSICISTKFVDNVHIMKSINQEQLDLIEKLFDAKLGTIQISINGIRKDICSINKAINGNGQPGLLQRVESNEKSMSTLITKFGFITAIFLFIAGIIEAIIPATVSVFFHR